MRGNQTTLTNKIENTDHLLLLFKVHLAPCALEHVSGTFEADEQSVAQQ